MIRFPFTSKRKFDPVTASTAPKNPTFAFIVSVIPLEAGRDFSQ
jgi:hypothetical protein